MIFFKGPVAPFDCASEVNGNSTKEEALKNALLCGTGYNTRQRPVKNQQDRVAMYIGADVMNVELVGCANCYDQYHGLFVQQSRLFKKLSVELFIVTIYRSSTYRVKTSDEIKIYGYSA